MFIRKRLQDYKPTSRMFFNVHLDGMEATHDLCVEREGRLPRGGGGHQVRQGPRFPGVHQHHDLQTDRSERNCRDV